MGILEEPEVVVELMVEVVVMVAAILPDLLVLLVHLNMLDQLAALLFVVPDLTMVKQLAVQPVPLVQLDVVMLLPDSLCSCLKKCIFFLPANSASFSAM